MDCPLGKSSRAGQIIIFFAGSIIALFCVLALALDVGHLAASKAKLQNSADAAALAALLELWQERALPRGEGEARVAAAAEAGRLVEFNDAGAGAQITFGTWDGSSFSAVGPDMAANAVKVQSYRNGEAPGGPVQTFFARIAGVDEVNQTAWAIARFQHKKLVPFSIYEEDIVPPGDSLELYNNTEETPGVFGLLDFAFDLGHRCPVRKRLWNLGQVVDNIEPGINDIAAIVLLASGVLLVELTLRDTLSHR